MAFKVNDLMIQLPDEAVRLCGVGALTQCGACSLIAISHCGISHGCGPCSLAAVSHCGACSVAVTLGCGCTHTCAGCSLIISHCGAAACSLIISHCGACSAAVSICACSLVISHCGAGGQTLVPCALATLPNCGPTFGCGVSGDPGPLDGSAVDLATLKAQLQQALTQVEAQEAAQTESLKPQTLDQVTQLEEQLKGALEELAGRRQELQNQAKG